MNCVKSAWCLLGNISIFKFGKTFNFLKNFVELPKSIVCCQTFFRQCKKTYTQTWKCPFLRSFKTLVQISTSTEVNHFTSKKLNIRRKNFLGNFGCINENRLSLRRRHFFHPYDLVLTSKPSKTSKFYHFNVLKCNFCFIINI